MKPLLISLFTLFLLHSKASCQTPIKLEDINKHIGDSVKICSKVYGGGFLSRLPGSPTYLYVGNDAPYNQLAVMIAKKDKGNFEDSPEMIYAYKNVCITGKLQLEKGKPIIIVTKPEQIVIQK